MRYFELQGTGRAPTSEESQILEIAISNLMKRDINFNHLDVEKEFFTLSPESKEDLIVLEF